MKPVHPRASKRLIARILAYLKKNGATTDSHLYQELGCTLGHIYDAREREPRIGCRMLVSTGWDKRGNETAGGYLLHLATRKELRDRAAAYREGIRKDRETLALIRKALRQGRK